MPEIPFLSFCKALVKFNSAGAISAILVIGLQEMGTDAARARKMRRLLRVSQSNLYCKIKGREGTASLSFVLHQKLQHKTTNKRHLIQNPEQNTEHD